MSGTRPICPPVLVTMTWFDSLESVGSFAGLAYEAPVPAETARRLLARHEDRALHHELRASDPERP